MASMEITLSGVVRKLVDQSLIHGPVLAQIQFEDAYTLYDELRIPNRGWTVGDRVHIRLVPPVS
jgi:hypothetical protein